MHKKNTCYQQGFTWVELAVVLVVITALLIFIYGPSSGAFDSQQTSETKKVAAAFETAINDVRLQWSAEGGRKQKVEFNGLFIEVTESGWAKQLNASVNGCMAIWKSVLPNSPDIQVYNREVHAPGWSVGGGPNICYFINQDGEAFVEDETPYFRYAYETGQVSPYNM
ncbi:hypothetical protein imdm_1140 [gamma proteobacterium IMCC2047]|nr:hypothetical protein imdm_1140 [gamma proteobacterium IMCC2047]